MPRKKTADPSPADATPPSVLTSAPPAPRLRKRATPRTGAAAEAAARAEAAGQSGSKPLSGGNGAPVSMSPTYEQIAEAAYQRYLSRGGNHGNDLDDWIDGASSASQ